MKTILAINEHENLKKKKSVKIYCNFIKTLGWLDKNSYLYELLKKGIIKKKRKITLFSRKFLCNKIYHENHHQFSIIKAYFQFSYRY